MHRSLLFGLIGLLVSLPVPHASAQVTLYHDRTTFTAVLTSLPHIENFDAYAPGDIAAGDVRGDFRYSFDAAITQPAIVPDGSGGQALGGSPFEVFVGGDSVTLAAGAGSALTAFGADFLYAPSFDTVPAGTYRLVIANGAAAGQYAGSLDTIPTDGGSFFLGLLVDPGFEFTEVHLRSVQLDPAFLVPAYQIDNLIYTGEVVAPTPAQVPEPGAVLLLVLGTVGGILMRRRPKHHSE